MTGIPRCTSPSHCSRAIATSNTVGYTRCMGNVIAGITMSLDGYVHDRHGSVEKLYSDFGPMHDVPSFQATVAQTGAVVMGKRAFEMGAPDEYADTYEFQVPIFVLTHSAPLQHPRETDRLTFTFVTDGIGSAIAQARQAAGDKDVQVIGGASTIQQCLNAGLCDELHLDIAPVMLGAGLRLLEHIDTDSMTFATINVEQATPVRTTIRLKVMR